MARRKKGRAIHGWLVLDKPVGMTSTQAVGAVRRLFDARKAGHAGTLDPLATGVLPIALGEATKTVPYAVDGTKHYRFTVRWGAGTDTDDAEGQTTATSELRPSREAIEALLPRFTGEIMQTPPAFSAIKVDGNRAYDLARAGEIVELEARPVQIDSLTLIDMPDPDTSVFEARCGKGTYVRALARDMGAELGCLGHLIALRRTRVAPFDEAQAVSLASLEAAAEQGEDALQALLRPIEAALQDLAEISVGQNDAARLLRGQAVLIRGRDAPTGTGPTYATCKGQLIAVGQIDKGELRPLRVFNFGNAG
jgi:tRNA pseudouridine55 synthase